MNDPNQALQSLLRPPELGETLFPPTSRYHGIELAKRIEDEGQTTIYLRRRFCPAPERFALLQEHTVTQGERMDNIAAIYLASPEEFWKICDANAAMKPDDLIEINRRLRIPLPEGIPELFNA